MKIGITGHTAGTGLQLSYKLSNKGHEIAGFSRSNGYTFRHDPSAAYRCVKKLIDEDFDVAVLNAPMGQDRVFTALYADWRDKEKRIVVVNSMLRYKQVIESGIGRKDVITTNLELYNAVENAIFDNLDGSRPWRKCLINHFTLGVIASKRKASGGPMADDPRTLDRDFVVDQIINTIESDRSIEQVDIVLRAV